MKLLVLSLFFSHLSFGAISNNWYTEDAFLDRENIYASLLRFRSEIPVTSFVSPYVTFGSDLQTPTSQISNVTASSYAFGGPGVKLNYLNAQLFSELRGRAYYQGNQNQKLLDARVLLAMGKYSDIALAEGRSLLGFYELYSETLYTSADENNVIEAAYARTGFRKPVLKELFIDSYVEPFFALDRVGHFYNNLVDLKLSLRFLYAIPGFSFSLTGSYLFNAYLDQATFENNPYRDQHSGFKILLVAGGTF